MLEQQLIEESLDMSEASEERCQLPRATIYRVSARSLIVNQHDKLQNSLDLNSLVSKETAIFSQICNSNQTMINTLGPKAMEAQFITESQQLNSIPDEPKEEGTQNDFKRYQLTTAKSLKSFQAIPRKDSQSQTHQTQQQKQQQLPQKEASIYKMFMDPTYACFYISQLKGTVSLPEKRQNEIQRIYQLHFSQTITQVHQKPQFSLPSMKLLKAKLIYLPQQGLIKNAQNKIPVPPSPPLKKSLILDLDETMVHCNEDLEQQADFYLSISISYGFNIKAGVRVRPHLIHFLEEMNKHYEIIVFTASHRIYAEAVLNKIDPNGQLVHFLFSRESCVQDKDQGCYIKDLRVVQGRDISQMVLVDNSTMSFIYQLENGIPIIPFYNNEQDDELLSLASFLRTLKDVPDVRPVIQQYFQLHKLLPFSEPKEAADSLYRF